MLEVPGHLAVLEVPGHLAVLESHLPEAALDKADRREGGKCHPRQEVLPSQCASKDRANPVPMETGREAGKMSTSGWTGSP